MHFTAVNSTHPVLTLALSCFLKSEDATQPLQTPFGSRPNVPLREFIHSVLSCPWSSFESTGNSSTTHRLNHGMAGAWARASNAFFRHWRCGQVLFSPDRFAMPGLDSVLLSSAPFHSWLERHHLPAAEVCRLDFMADARHIEQRIWVLVAGFPALLP